MTMKDYLRSQKAVSLSTLAFMMWPNNKKADNYLSAKLNDLANRKFTKKDEKNAIECLKKLSKNIIKDIENLDLIK